MDTFDFLSGQSAPNANAQAYSPMQQYQQFANTGSPQGMDYSQILSGGQASPATQGLDFSKIGQWALQQSQYHGQQAPGTNWQKLASQFGPTQPTMATGQKTPGMPSGGRAGGALGNVQGGPAGYLGHQAYPSLLGAIR